MRKLHRQFVTGQRLHKHVRFLYDKGGMYNVYNGNLLYHGCVPVDSNGAFDKLYIDGEFYHGRLCLTNVMRRQGLRMWTILIRMMWTLCGFCGEEKNHRCAAEGLRPLRWNMLQTRACGKSLLTHTTAGITIRASAVRYCTSSGCMMMMRIS